MTETGTLVQARGQSLVSCCALWAKRRLQCFDWRRETDGLKTSGVQLSGLYAGLVHWWQDEGVLHSTPAFFLFSESVVRPRRLLKCEEAEAVVQLCSENLDTGFWCKYVAQTDPRDA